MTASLPAQLGRYRIVRPLSQGAAGTLCLAEEVQSRTPVLLTLPHFPPNDDPRLIERFHNEARLVSQVSHPSLCPVYETGSADGLHYLVTAHVEATPLAALVGPGRTWPPAQAVMLVAHLASALSMLHQRGVVYRELSPATILVRPDGLPVLTDGCLARSFSLAQLRTGRLAGQPYYLSPEQLLGQEQAIGPASDIWSLGVILYQLLTGDVPFHGQSFLALRDQIVAARPAAPSARRPGLDPRLDAVCLQMLSRDPAQRMAGLHGLALLVSAPPPPAPTVAFTPTPPSLAPVPVRSQGRSSPLLLVGLCIGTVLLLLVVVGSLVMGGFFAGGGPPVAEAGSSPTQGTSATQGGPPTQATVPTQATGPTRPIVIVPPPVKEPPHVIRAAGLKFVEVPAGQFKMGSPRAFDDGTRTLVDELPQRQVQISRPFLMGMYEVTQAEFEKVMGYNPSWFAADGGGAARLQGADSKRLPAERVTWKEAMSFCILLSDRPDEKKAGRTYRLPTEAEWEYACRAGGPAGQEFQGGKALDASQANIGGTTGSRRSPSAVGSYKPNPWGLFDMHGNVAEWCSDWYSDNYYSRGVNIDPPGPDHGTSRVLRGGSWLADAGRGRCARRDQLLPGIRDESVGFRVVCVPPSP